MNRKGCGGKKWEEKRKTRLQERGRKGGAKRGGQGTYKKRIRWMRREERRGKKEIKRR